jgi:hypothetical protein
MLIRDTVDKKEMFVNTIPSNASDTAAMTSMGLVDSM